MKHKHQYRYYIVPQDLINFLKGDGVYKNDKRRFDDQVYSHFGEHKQHSDKYIGIIIEFQRQKYFAPLTHDGNRHWFNREDTCDFERIYNNLNHYVGSILLCKALPLTDNLVTHLTLEEIFSNEGERYGRLCAAELTYLNSKEIHDKIQDKMQACIYDKDSPYKHYRVKYQLVTENVKEYNKLKQQELLMVKPKEH